MTKKEKRALRIIATVFLLTALIAGLGLGFGWTAVLHGLLVIVIIIAALAFVASDLFPYAVTTFLGGALVLLVLIVLWKLTEPLFK